MVRIKHRYLLVDILYPSGNPHFSKIAARTADIPAHVAIHAPSPNHLTPALLAKLIREEIAVNFGDWGVGRLGTGGLGVKYFSPATSTAIIRCPRAAFRIVWAALSFMDRIPSPSGADVGTPCVFRVLRVSGTMRKAEEEAIRRARREILRTRKMMADRGEEEGLGDALSLGRGEVPGDGGNSNSAAADFVVDDDDDDVMDDEDDD